MYLIFAWRYFKAKKSTNAINIIAWVSVTAIAFATAALLVLWSAFNGFEGLVKSLYSTFYTDLKITPASGKTIILTPSQIAELKKISNISNLSLVAEEKALLQNQDYQAIVELKGVDSNYTKVTTVEKSLVRGRFSLGDAENPGAVMGVGIENAVAILSDRAIGGLTVYLPKKGVDDISNPLASFNEGRIIPNGAFAVEQGFDNKYVLTNLDFVRQYMNFKPDEYSAAEIALADTDNEEITKSQIRQLLGPHYTVQTRYEQNSSLYNVMRLEKYAIFGIFILVLVVAAFNMIGALSMLVLEKQKDIQILQSMGADRGWIQKVFLTEGIVLAAIGAGIGIILALLLCFLQLQFKLIPLEGTSFIIDYYPVKLVFSDFVIVAITVFIIALTASWLPSKRAAAQPFELRN
ncbi:FtsX-like permease family protein [Agriterribacter sp.]|uniref:FtsX-like permease family protein n=1 Tax=Agriterribacter sp. TaxID=2821509 RepID=UPI002B5D6B41|nr:FtsX-like permease family protein [Agriterribacter sp.]HRP54597.1 FtsX-like permease family protein [Agriterribacter sp.]